MVHLSGVLAISVLCVMSAVLNSSLALVLGSPSTSHILKRHSRSHSDKNTCYNLGLHATCMGTSSSSKAELRTLAELLSLFRLPPNIQHLTISQNVDLSSRNLHMLENLIELNISNNAAASATMDENFLGHFPRLTTLKIVKSGLTTLPVFRDRHPSLINLVL